MKVRNLLALLLLAAIPCCWTACSDSDNEINQADQDDKPAEYQKMSAKTAADYAAENFIAHVCQVVYDTLTFRPVSWELNYGRVLYPATPNVRYDRAESQEAARQKFLSLICQEMEVDSLFSGEIYVDMGSHGSVRYNPSAENGAFAEVEVNLKELPDLAKIVYVRPEAWPENAGKCGVNKNTVFKRSENFRGASRDVYYICIDECDDGTGYLIGFDTWTIDPTGPSSDHHHKGRDCYDAWWRNLPGGAGLIRSLRGFLYYSNGARYDKAEKIIRKVYQLQGGNEHNARLCGEDALYNFLYSEGNLAGRKPYFKTGDDCCWVDTYGSGESAWHWARTPYTMMEPDHISWSKIEYECDEIDPYEYDGDNTHARNSGASSWGQAWCCSQFGSEWIWKVNEWYSFQTPFVIEFHDTDATNLKEFRARYGLEIVNLDI